MFSGIVLMSICVIIIGGNFEQAHQNMLTDKAMMSQENPTLSRGNTNDLNLHTSCKTLPERQSSLQFEQIAPKEHRKSLFGSTRKTSTVGRMKRQKLQLACKNLEEKFGDLTERIAHLESEGEKATKEASSQFPWLLRSNLLNLPSELLNDVMVFLNDNDRFLLRGLNISFYKAYYNQRINYVKTIFNFKRSINLAMRDRVFRNVQVMCLTPNEVSSLALANISIHSFPNLRVFKARCRVLSDGNTKWHLSESLAALRHKSIKQLDVFLSDVPASGNCLVQLCRFPRLKILNITFKHHSKYPLSSPHSSLQTINLTNGSLKNKVKGKDFPALRKVNIYGTSSTSREPLQSIRLQ